MSAFNIPQTVSIALYLIEEFNGETLNGGNGVPVKEKQLPSHSCECDIS